VTAVSNHRDVAILQRLSRRHPISKFPGREGLVVGDPLLSRSLLVESRVDKSVPALHATQKLCDYPALQKFAHTNLLLMDGSKHLERRALLQRCCDLSTPGQIGAITEFTAQHVNIVLDGRHVDVEGDIAGPLAEYVLTRVLDVPLGSPSLAALLRIAPRMNQLAFSFDGAAEIERLYGEFETLLQVSPTQTKSEVGFIGRVAAHGVSMEEVIGLAAFLAAAAVETIQSLVASLVLFGRAHDRTIDVLRRYSPVPFVFYGPSPGRWDDTLAAAEKILALSLGDGVFGYGAHSCLGARISLAVGDSILAATRKSSRAFAQASPHEWTAHGLVRTVSARGHFEHVQ
jgi:cytochrome P450